jgi:DNA-binding XRE family transcriptional regulator
MSTKDLDFFRNNLKIARALKQITAKELSAALGLKQMKRIADIEEGRGLPSLTEVSDICKYFDVPIDDMLYRQAKISIEFI